jgi:hypothetical protein
LSIVGASNNIHMYLVDDFCHKYPLNESQTFYTCHQWWKICKQHWCQLLRWMHNSFRLWAIQTICEMEHSTDTLQ